MVTKQTEPDLDSWKEQEDRQRRAARNRKIGALAVAAVIVAIAAFTIVASMGDGRSGVPAGGNSSDPVNVVTHYFLDIETGERSPVPTDLSGAAIPDVSPDGDDVVYGTCCTSADAIYVTPLDGSSDRTTITTGELNGYGARWIDDETILFQRREADSSRIGDLYTADVVTGEVSLLVDLPDLKNGAWIVISDVSPDGSTVLYHLPRGKGADNVTWDLWTVSIEGGEPTLLREHAGYATYTSDGSIVFLGGLYPFGGSELWIMNGDGSDARLISDGRGFSWPQASPDGSTIAYGNEETGKVELVGIDSGRITELDELSKEPAWYGDDTLIVD